MLSPLGTKERVHVFRDSCILSLRQFVHFLHTFLSPKFIQNLDQTWDEKKQLHTFLQW
jgi:hypothetical protein